MLLFAYRYPIDDIGVCECMMLHGWHELYLVVFKHNISYFPCRFTWERYMHVPQAWIVHLSECLVTILYNFLSRPSLRELLLRCLFSGNERSTITNYMSFFMLGHDSLTAFDSSRDRHLEFVVHRVMHHLRLLLICGQVLLNIVDL